MEIKLTNKTMNWFKEQMEVEQATISAFTHDTVVPLLFMKDFHLG